MILSYAAMGAEADLGAFHRWAEGEGKRLVFPVTGPGGAMDAWEARDRGLGAGGGLGSRSRIPGWPGRRFRGRLRLSWFPAWGLTGPARPAGPGGGYYDRYLPRCPGAFCLGVAFECQRLTELVPEDPWDVPLQAVVTEKGVYGHKYLLSCFFGAGCL